jgi:hypothetical protein
VYYRDVHGGAVAVDFSTNHRGAVAVELLKDFFF